MRGEGEGGRGGRDGGGEGREGMEGSVSRRERSRGPGLVTCVTGSALTGLAGPGPD